MARWLAPSSERLFLDLLLHSVSLSLYFEILLKRKKEISARWLAPSSKELFLDLLMHSISLSLYFEILLKRKKDSKFTFFDKGYPIENVKK